MRITLEPQALGTHRQVTGFCHPQRAQKQEEIIAFSGTFRGSPQLSIFIAALAGVSKSCATTARVGFIFTGYFVTNWNWDCKALPAKQQRQGGLPWCLSAFRVRCSELGFEVNLVRMTALLQTQLLNPRTALPANITITATPGNVFFLFSKKNVLS